ncbi:hypothetical protein Dimus_036038, partial [Dionaea muscipula]
AYQQILLNNPPSVDVCNNSDGNEAARKARARTEVLIEAFYNEMVVKLLFDLVKAVIEKKGREMNAESRSLWQVVKKKKADLEAKGEKSQIT